MNKQMNEWVNELMNERISAGLLVFFCGKVDTKPRALRARLGTAPRSGKKEKSEKVAHVTA